MPSKYKIILLCLPLLVLILWFYTRNDANRGDFLNQPKKSNTDAHTEFLLLSKKHHNNNILDSAAFFLDKAILNKAENHWDSLLSELLFRVGLHYHEVSFYSNAIPYLELLTENFNHHNSRYYQIIGLQHLAASRTFEGRFDFAQNTYFEMKAFLDQLETEKHTADSLIDMYVSYYFGLGINNAIQGDFKGSLKWFMTADSLLKHGGSRPYKVASLLYLGNINTELAQTKTALIYYEKVEKLHQQGEKVDLLQLYDNMALCYTQIEEYEKALTYLDKNLVLAREKGDSFVVGLNFKERSNIDEKQNRFIPAFDNAKKAIQAFEIAGSTIMVFETMVHKISLAILAESELDSADAVQLKEALTFFDTSGLKPKYFRGLKVLANLYAYQNRYKEASQTLEKYAELYTDWIEENYNNQTVAMQTNFKTEMYKSEAALASDLKIQSAKLNRLLIYMSISASLLLIVVFFLVYLYKKLSLSRAKIQIQKGSLEKRDLEKSMLIKELHHRVKNNLQIVSSLLNLQSQSTKDKKAQNAFKEGKHRVEAMAMIHKYLYTSEALTDVDIKSYLIRLVDSIAFAYGYNKKNILMALDIKPTFLDVDVAIPLGLIANEMVSNAFKHAFNKVKKPRLQISFTNNGSFCFEVSDNGKGLGKKTLESCQGSFGLDLIKSLSCQLNATLEYRYESGAVFILTIPKNTILKRKLLL